MAVVEACGDVVDAEDVVVVGDLIVDEAEALAEFVGGLGAGVGELEVGVPGLVLCDEVVERDFAGLHAGRDRGVNASAWVSVESVEVVVELIALDE